MSENVKDYVEIWRDFQPHEYLGMTDAEGAMAMEIGKLRAENERLRARVTKLEQALQWYAEDEYNGHNATGACARAALKETTP